MELGDAIKTFYRCYADFEGRSSRSEYWWVALYRYFVMFVLALPVIHSMETGLTSDMSVLATVSGVLLALFIRTNYWNFSRS